MRPRDIQAIGAELAVKWDDGSESFIPLEMLRRGCPCAECKGEADILGNVYKNPEPTLDPAGVPVGSVSSLSAATPFSRSGGTGTQRGFIPLII